MNLVHARIDLFAGEFRVLQLFALAGQLLRENIPLEGQHYLLGV